MRFRSRVRTLGGLSIVVLAPIFLSCSDSTGPGLSSRYVLSTVDGSPLPYDLVNVVTTDGTGGRQTVLADTIQILNEQDFRRTGSVSTLSILNGATQITPYVMAGGYTLRDNMLAVQWIGYEPSPSGPIPTPFSESFSLEGSTLRIKRAVGPRCIDGTPQCADRPLVDFVYVAR